MGIINVWLSYVVTHTTACYSKKKMVSDDITTIGILISENCGKL